MKTSNSARLRAALFGLLVSGTTLACSQTVENIGPGPTTRDASPDVGPADLGEAPVDSGAFVDVGPPDAGFPVDLGPADSGVTRDLGPPARTLVTRRVMGETPLNNLVMNPLFDTTSALRPATSNGQSPARLFLPRTPTGTPVARIEGPETLALFVQSDAGPLEATIWLGWEGLTPPSPLGVFIVGLGTTRFQTGAELTVDPATERTIDGITWVQYGGTIQDRMLGHALLTVQAATGTVYVCGPVVVPQPSAVIGAPNELRIARPLTLEPALRAELEAIIERWSSEHGRSLKPPKRIYRWDELPELNLR